MDDPNPRSSEPVAAIILAAGASTRMGRPKALVRWRGRTFLDHAVALAAGCDPVIVVSGAHPLEGSVPVGATRVHNANWRRGPLSSLQAGLGGIPEDRSVLLLTVDRPHVAPETIRLLLAAHAGEPRAVVQPGHRGERGHPIVLPADLVGEARALDPTDTLRSLLRRADVQPRRRTVATDDAAVVENLDRPEDLERLPDP